jgi:hypothetical protein
MTVIQKKNGMKARGEAKIPQSPNLSLNCLKLKPNATHNNITKVQNKSGIQKAALSPR